jgi:hypothetical protein
MPTEHVDRVGLDFGAERSPTFFGNQVEKIHDTERQVGANSHFDLANDPFLAPHVDGASGKLDTKSSSPERYTSAYKGIAEELDASLKVTAYIDGREPCRIHPRARPTYHSFSGEAERKRCPRPLQAEVSPLLR